MHTYSFQICIMHKQRIRISNNKVKRISKVLVVLLMMASSVGFAAFDRNGDYYSCSLGCKYFYEGCKQVNEMLDLHDDDCEKTMTDCNKNCYALYYSEQ